MKKAIVALCVAGGLVMMAGFGFLVYLGLTGPETYVVGGKQIPARFTNEIRKLGLLEPGEQMQFFYSDALLDIKGGFYAATDRKVIVYSDAWTPPGIVTPYGEIADVKADRSGNWFVDTGVVLTLKDGSTVDFALSAERDGDLRFVNYVRSRLPR